MRGDVRARMIFGVLQQDNMIVDVADNGATTRRSNLLLGVAYLHSLGIPEGTRELLLED